MSGVRRLGSWIESFCEYTDILSSPLLFRKWAAITTVSQVLERRVWVRSKGSDLFPNLYVILVGPPGVGKSAALSQSEKLIRQVPEIHVAASSVSAASLIDSLAETTVKKVRPAAVPPYLEYNCLNVIASEFGMFLPTYEHSFMNLLTKAYDGEFLEDRKRGGKLHVKIKAPLLSIVGGTTPSYLNSVLPEGAWEQGFTSRTIFVYSGEGRITHIFDSDEQHTKYSRIYDDLLVDIKQIASDEIIGQFHFEKAAMEAITNWHMTGQPPVPSHNKLVNYNTRRTAHLLKLCMVASVDKNGELIVTIDNYQQALGWLLEAESFMPDIFLSMAQGGDSQAIEDCFHFIYSIWIKEDKPIPEHRITYFLQQRVPSHSVMKVMEMMVRSRIIEQVDSNGPRSSMRYRPIQKINR